MSFLKILCRRALFYMFSLFAFCICLLCPSLPSFFFSLFLCVCDSVFRRIFRCFSASVTPSFPLAAFHWLPCWLNHSPAFFLPITVTVPTAIVNLYEVGLACQLQATAVGPCWKTHTHLRIYAYILLKPHTHTQTHVYTGIQRWE